MLYVIHGTDIAKGRDKSGSLIASLRSKRPDATFVRIDGDNWSPDLIQEHAGGQGLFSNKYIIFLDRVTENARAKEELVDLVELMKESTNVFIVLEAKVLTELKKAFEKYAEKVVECEEVKDLKKESKSDFNIFALADAVGSRDSLKSWIIYRQAVDSGLEAESIIGTLFWQVKSMILARNTNSATESGLNPFVFSKSKKYASNYSEKELNILMEKLVTLYHDGHRGMRDLELSVERMMLGVGR